MTCPRYTQLTPELIWTHASCLQRLLWGHQLLAASLNHSLVRGKSANMILLVTSHKGLLATGMSLQSPHLTSEGTLHLQSPQQDLPRNLPRKQGADSWIWNRNRKSHRRLESEWLRESTELRATELLLIWHPGMDGWEGQADPWSWSFSLSLEEWSSHRSLCAS